MKISTLVKAATVVGLGFTLMACDNQGPMEKAGEKVDNAATDTQNAIEDKCEDIKSDLDQKDTDC
ncbi:MULTISPECIES: hypothetical protein [Vibrio]|uniref:Lipoprotein n=2 Tax=Vibrio TaxID=662 RepID=A0A7X4RWT0_9VIBR|nr:MULTISPECIES: hypothetical protein [Vibrio]MBF9003301.1 hypothetical protein [Vibrio nitrifigilis]MZI95677.1 hypothetical protein [Vibrio eleionomae]